VYGIYVMMETQSLWTRLENAPGRPSDTRAEDVCELFSLWLALSDSQKLCSHLRKELEEAYQMVADCKCAYEGLVSRTKQKQAEGPPRWPKKCSRSDTVVLYWHKISI